MIDHDSYPVIVTYTHRHVIWVEAEDHKAAVERACWDTWELTNDQETLYESSIEVAGPKYDFDWDDIYEGTYLSPYQGRDFEAHVETRRRWLRKVERDHELAMTEYEDRDETPADDRQTCGLCRKWREPGHEATSWHQFELRSQVVIA